MRPGSIAWRLFLTCWIVYALHFATDISREIYPAVALGDHFSFRVDEYAGLHSDLFEKEGYGWHIGNNPGVSLLAAIPYALARPIIDPIVARVQERRRGRGEIDPPTYDTPWPNEREFFEQAWVRGFDVKLGLAAFVMQVFFMAPISALSAVVMFFLLRRLLHSQRTAVWLAILYAFGTAVFFRTGFLNHNLMLGHLAFFGFVAMWNPGERVPETSRTRYLFGGLMGGAAILFDYSGIVFLLALFAYAALRGLQAGGSREAVRRCGWYIAGSLLPVALLLFYQWRSFGHPFYPGQHWMPVVEWSDLGYRGYGPPQLELLWALAFNHRFGLFTTSPLLLLGLLYPLFRRRDPHVLPARELAFMLLTFVGLWVFFSGSNYTRLQFNTGLRYMTPIIPFLFVPAAFLVNRLPRVLAYGIGLLSVGQAWCLAMYREVEVPLGVLDPVIRTFVEGFQLPALRTIWRTGGYYMDLGEHGVSPLPLFVLTGTIIFGVWRIRLSRKHAQRGRP